jgi:hypothetical protein
MKKMAFPCFAAVTGLTLVWLFVGCEPHEHVANGSVPESTGLVGRWHYDSAGAAFYDRRGHFSHRFMDPPSSDAWLTIGRERWTYSGSVREEHVYSRRGNTVWVRRLVDSALVRGGHARLEDLGQVIGFTDTLLLSSLTPHRLVVCDSTTDPDGSLTRVWSYYYSRY